MSSNRLFFPDFFFFTSATDLAEKEGMLVVVEMSLLEMYLKFQVRSPVKFQNEPEPAF